MMPKTLIASAILVLATGCTYDNGHGHMSSGTGGSGGTGGSAVDVAESTIDTGATLAEIEPGEGVGAFVEVSSGGQWHVYTACDTNVSGYACVWDIVVSAFDGDEITSQEADRLEDYDYVDWYGDRSVRMVAENSYGFDGFFFDATPGATIRVDVFLDGAPSSRYIYWVGDGGLHKGSPTNPIDLTPSSP